MQPFLQVQDIPSLDAFYASCIIVGLGLLFFIFKIFEIWYASKYHRPLYRQLFAYKKLTKKDSDYLSANFSFYNLLSQKHRRQFEHRINTFIRSKEWVGREGLEVTRAQQLLVAAVACMLSFGRKNYIYKLIDYVLIYPDTFFSTTNEAYHKGEFNPKERSLVLSWKHFEHGYRITDDNFNLGIHECMHAMHLEAKIGKGLDSVRFMQFFNKVLQQLKDEELRKTLDNTKFFRAYAFTNQYEFTAVMAEYFFESPAEFKQYFPKLYAYFATMLNYKNLINCY